jgi:uncharacterized delta-60 repeat protein
MNLSVPVRTTYLCAAWMSLACAADGDLDTTFATQGQTYLSWQNGLYNGHSAVYAATVLAQPDGKLVDIATIQFTRGGAGYQGIGVFRVLADGSPDPAFGDGAVAGQIVLTPDDGKYWEESGATLDANGNIIIAGTSYDSTTGQVAIWKLTSDGVPQPSFGSGNGMVLIDRGVTSNDTGWDVIAGDGTNEPLGTLFVSAVVNDVGAIHSDPAVFFLAADGSPLTTSGGVGNQTLPNGGRFWQGPSSCPFDTGESGVYRLPKLSFNPQYFAGHSTHYLIAAGDCSSSNFTSKVIALALGSESNFDATFGNGGMSYLSFDQDFADSTSTLNGLAVSVDSAGTEKILLVGGDTDPSGGKHIGLARLRFNGQYDTTFGVGGHITIVGGACCNQTADQSEADAALVQHDGKTIVGATIFDGTNYSQALLRLDPNGTGDATFGATGSLSGGRLYPPAEAGSPFEDVYALAFTAGEKIVLAALDVDNVGNQYASLLRAQNDRIFTAGFDPLPIPP